MNRDSLPRGTVARRWFVYSNATYYPDAEIYEAETAEEAASMFYDQSAELAVFPLAALALWRGERPIESTLDGLGGEPTL